MYNLGAVEALDSKKKYTETRARKVYNGRYV